MRASHHAARPLISLAVVGLAAEGPHSQTTQWYGAREALLIYTLRHLIKLRHVSALATQCQTRIFPLRLLNTRPLPVHLINSTPFVSKDAPGALSLFPFEDFKFGESYENLARFGKSTDGFNIDIESTCASRTQRRMSNAMATYLTNAAPASFVSSTAGSDDRDSGAGATGENAALSNKCRQKSYQGLIEHSQTE